MRGGEVERRPSHHRVLAAGMDAIEHMHEPDWPASQVMTIMMVTMTAWIEQEIMLYMYLARL